MNRLCKIKGRYRNYIAEKNELKAPFCSAWNPALNGYFSFWKNLS